MVKARAFDQHDYNRMIASLCSGFVQSMVGHPIDSIKIRMALPENKTGFIKTIRNMYVKEGLQPFYRGALPPSIGKMISYCVFFTTNGYLKDTLRDYRGLNEGEILSLSDTCLVGTVCGAVLAPVMTPVEYIKIQLQADKHIDGVMFGRKYKNMFDCTKRCIEHRVIFRGYLAMTLRLAPAWGVYLGIYDAFNRWFEAKATLGKIDTLSSFSATGRVIMAGGLAGIFAWIISYPQDYIKTQIQAADIQKWNYTHSKQRISPAPTIRDVVEITMKRHGPRGFFRGLTPCLIRAFPANLTNFWVYESVLQLLERSTDVDGDED